MNRNTKLNQAQAVLRYMRMKRNSKMTSAEIAEGVKKNFKVKFTPHQVSKCLNKFASREVVSYDRKGVSQRGTPCYRWSLNRTK